MAADSKARLEDIYLPYKPKRRTKAQIASEAGLEPLADRMLGDPAADPHAGGRGLRGRGQGRARCRGRARWRARDPGRALRRGRRPHRSSARADVVAGPAGVARARGQAGGRAPISPTTSTSTSRSRGCPRTGSWPCSAARRRKSSTSRSTRGTSRTRRATPRAATNCGSPSASASPIAGGPASRWLMDTVRWAWRTRIIVHLSIDLRMRLWQRGRGRGGAGVRRQPARPAARRARRRAGRRMGLDPGFRTGVKVAVVDATGKVRRDRRRSIRTSRSGAGTTRWRCWPGSRAHTRSN